MTRLDRLAAQALEIVGKIRIVDDFEPRFSHAVASTDPLPPEGGYPNSVRPRSPQAQGITRGLQMPPSAYRLDEPIEPSPEGGGWAAPQAPPLGYYRLIRNGTSEKIEGV